MERTELLLRGRTEKTDLLPTARAVNADDSIPTISTVVRYWLGEHTRIAEQPFKRFTRPW